VFELRAGRDRAGVSAGSPAAEPRIGLGSESANQFGCQWRGKPTDFPNVDDALLTSESDGPGFVLPQAVDASHVVPRMRGIPPVTFKLATCRAGHKSIPVQRAMLIRYSVQC
jgi:hypothetical protein